MITKTVALGSLTTLSLLLSALPVLAGNGSPTSMGFHALSQDVSASDYLLYQAPDPRVTLDLKGVTPAAFFDALKKQTGYDFVYSASLFPQGETVTAAFKDAPLSKVLDETLSAKGLAFSITGKIVTIKKAEKKAASASSDKRKVIGVVVDDTNFPVAGATVLVPKYKIFTITDPDGRYTLEVPKEEKLSVKISMVGLGEYDAVIPSGDKEYRLDATLGESTDLEEVVVTGIYTRSKGSFTGSSLAFTGDELKNVGTSNALASLKNMDPSLYIPDNFALGSDPNSLPDITLRGVSSLPQELGGAGSLKSQFGNNPNQPLFILDGFEVGIETIMDMDMNRIESITTLKDASAKALYGSKAANGVIVIDTKKLQGSEQRITYTGQVSLELPDLTSYNLTNAAEKLEVELLDGVYTGSNYNQKIAKQELYNSRRKLILEGLDTDWISKPIRVGVGQKHGLSIELGDANNLRASADLSYNLVNGAMKGSSRQNIATTLNVSYRRKNLLFRDILTVNYNNSTDSPYGSFSEYARMNPYWQATDADGNVLRWAEEGIPNPLYNAEIGTSLKNKYVQIINNFQAEWWITEALKASTRFGVTTKKSQLDHFLPPLHSSFATSTDVATKGSYTLENTESQNLSGDINVSYNKSFGSHNLFSNAGFFVSQNQSSAYGHIARGFSNNTAADITFANGYQADTKPSGQSILNREVSGLLSLAYDYASRYLLDGTFRISASSLYGKNNRWAPSWSLGTGWNIHNEEWFKPIQKTVSRFKIRGSVGMTGNQSFTTNSAIATYRYFTGVQYGGFTGAYLSAMPNPDLKWEQKIDYNVGLDLVVSRLSLTLDFYTADTHNMLTDLAIPASTGFTVVKDNLGLVKNTGIDTRLSWRVWEGKNGFVNLFGSAIWNKNYIVRLSDSLREYNDRMREQSKNTQSSSPVPLYEDGQSMTTIWAVQSAGIDPTNGRELFVKKDGSLTYDYDPTDLIPAGDTSPKLRGNGGISAEWHGIGANVIVSYILGGQQYNSTLVSKVENANITYNVDRRLAEGRWRTPGQVTRYKKFDSSQKTRPTTRIIQDQNELTISSVSLYYEVPREVLRADWLGRLRLSCNMNNIATFSSIEIERGTAYPFARQLSFSILATF